jgi:hypothetical protein
MDNVHKDGYHNKTTKNESKSGIVLTLVFNGCVFKSEAKEHARICPIKRVFVVVVKCWTCEHVVYIKRSQLVMLAKQLCCLLHRFLLLNTTTAISKHLFMMTQFTDFCNFEFNEN